MKIRSLAKLGSAAALAVGLTLGAAGAAGAAQSSAAGTPSSFAAQARAAGLTSAQVATLQGEANGFIAEHGGTQVALNKVQFPGGDILFAVPGETYARDLGTASTDTTAPAVDETCPILYFCAYHGTNYTGTAIQLTQCNVQTVMPWTVTGSWKNDQSEGTRAYFTLIDGSVVATPGAWSADPSYDWAPVLLIEACRS